MLRSNVFYSPRAYRALVKSPVEFVAGSYRLYGLQPDDGAIAALRKMGQIPFHPPNVKGWDGGLSWINSRNLDRARELSEFADDGQGRRLVARRRECRRTPATRRSAYRRRFSKTTCRLRESHGWSRTSTAKGRGRPMFSGENYPERIRGAAYLAMATPAYQLN